MGGAAMNELPPCCRFRTISAASDLAVHHVSCPHSPAAVQTRLDSLRLTRTPTTEEMEAHLGEGVEGFLDGWTIRRCRECYTPVAGGPTLCDRCGSPALRALRELVRVLCDLGEVPGSVKGPLDAAKRALR